MALLLASCAGTGPAGAQGLGWLFGEPPVHRQRRVQRARPLPADVPLPVPRPRFFADEAAGAAPRQEADAHPPAAQPAEVAPAAPLPPERSADVAPQQPASKTPPPTGASDQSAAAAPSTELSTPALPKPALPKLALPKLDPNKSEPPKSEAPKPAPQAAEPKNAVEPDKPQAGAVPLPPEKPADLTPAPSAPAPAATPPAAPPAVAPSGATTAFDPREPAADPGCADRLKARGVVIEPISLPPQPDARCTVVQPVHLYSATASDGTTVAFPDKPIVACITADAFSAFVHDLLAPLAKGTWGTGVTSVWTGPGLECRSRDHVFGAKLSAHGQGLAVDIAKLQLGDGRLVAVGEPKTDAERGFETAARAGGCGYFHTVLGPGSDSYHRTHWHFDLEVRGREGDSKYCK